MLTVKPRPLRAVLFDLDGTLVDSEPNYHRSDKLFLRDKGIQLPEPRWAGVVGMGSGAFIEMVRKEFGLVGETTRLLEEKNQYYLKHAEGNTRPFPEMLKFLELSREAGLLTAVASGSSPEIIRKSVGWAGIEADFDLLLSAEEVQRGKPAPDVFLEAARRLGVQNLDCLVVEDSKPGVLAAKAAGMRCVAVPSSPDNLDPAFLQADHLFVGGMGDFLGDQLVDCLREAGVWPE